MRREAIIMDETKELLDIDNYLNITQPQALYLLKDIFGESVDLRFYKERKRYFHPKAYIVDYEKGNSEDEEYFAD